MTKAQEREAIRRYKQLKKARAIDRAEQITIIKKLREQHSLREVGEMLDMTGPGVAYFLNRYGNTK